VQNRFLYGLLIDGGFLAHYEQQQQQQAAGI